MKYIVRAVAEALGIVVLACIMSGSAILAINYFKPTVEDMGMFISVGLLLVAAYFLVGSRVEQLKALDRLNKLK